MKFDIPTKDEKRKIWIKIKTILKEDDWKINSESKDNVWITYYDTRNLDFYHRHSTLRRIKKLSQEKNRYIFRYDFKHGKLENRHEIKKWADKELTDDQILTFLDIRESLGIIPIATIRARHKFVIIEKQGAKAEIKFDYCQLSQRFSFQEMEAEFIEGNTKIFFEFFDKISAVLDLKSIKQQKYSRIIECLGLNKQKTNKICAEITLAIGKPDGVRKKLVGECIRRFKSAGLNIWYIKTIQLSLRQAEILKKDIKIKHPKIASDVIKYIMEGPVVIILIEGADAIRKVRKICGHANPCRASKGTIRGDFAEGDMEELYEKGVAVRNIVHSADSKEKAEKEIKLLLGNNFI